MLAKIFSRRQREKILAHMLGNPSRGYRVREIAKEFKVSVGSVSQFLALLKKNRILRRKGDIFFVETGNPLARAIKIVLNVAELDVAPLKRIPSLLGIGLYGSWANGTNREDSDVDIWVKVKKRVGQEIIARASGQLNRKTRHKAQVMVLDPEKSDQLKKEDPIFYYSLVYGSVVLYGESLED
jgi:predicted nucleotidyltransferase/predicted DNA-binding transcriptional regulator